MIIGVLSDTHSDRANALPHIIKEFKERNVDVIIHCGDIELQHVNPELFNGLEVTCALNQEQLIKFPTENPPPGWTFTRPGQRVLDIRGIRCYVGHKMSYDILIGSETDFEKKIELLRRDYDGLRWIFSGHTHHQIFFQTRLVNFVNPGAVENSFDGYEFTIIDTETNQIVFCRIPKTRPIEDSFSVGIISDSLNISRMDADFWGKLEKEFKERDVTHIIHCGNISLDDIGREELADFTVHYRLRPKQVPLSSPKNWHLVPKDEPTVEINDRQFYIHPNLARLLLEKSEVDMNKECLKILESYPEVTFILYGETNEGFLEEGERARIINPGDIISSRSFAVICMPRIEITFGHVPVDPLPSLQ
ncbi:MAG: metallophosphoesterase family protein [bacterium]|nr:metallophosphoesterase family protein [bacterium]